MITIRDITVIREPVDGVYTMSPLTNHVTYSIQEEAGGQLAVFGETISAATLDEALDKLEETLTAILCEPSRC